MIKAYKALEDIKKGQPVVINADGYAEVAKVEAVADGKCPVCGEAIVSIIPSFANMGLGSVGECLYGHQFTMDEAVE